MNHTRWTWLCAVLLFSALFVFWSAPRAQAGFTSVWAVDDGEKIFRDNITSPLKNGNSVWNGSSVSLFGCRNEIVAFKLILQADGSGATNADVQISNLTNGGNTIRGSHPLLAANNYLGMGVELFTEHYLNVSVLSGDPNGGYFNWSASAAPSVSGFTTGWLPDALIPFSAASGKGGAPFTIAANKNQGVWVDIYIDKGLPAGTYSGTITVKLNGSTYQTIPISLLVLSPTLSDTNHYQSMIYYGGGEIAERYGLDYSTQWPMILNYNRLAHRHRLDLIGSGSWDEISYLGGTLSGSAYTSASNYEGPGEGVGNSLFSVSTYGVGWPDTEADYRTNSDAWENWFAANAPSVTRFLYLIDEPGSDMFSWIETRASWIHNNPGPGKNLPVFITKAITSPLIGSVDIWCSPTQTYDQVAAAAAKARGEDVWSYAAYRPKSAADVMDDWSIAYRIKPWVAHKAGVSRWFTWESTHWRRNPNEINPGSAIDVFTDPLTFNTGSGGSTGNGDGTLFYPGRDYLFTGQDRNFAGPIASIRMKMYRRGEQDVEYMWLAEQAGKTAQVQNVLQDVLPHVMDSAVTVPDWSNSNAPYDAARRELADLAAGTVRAPSAKFSASTTRGASPLAVSFTDLSIFAPTSWSWTFGDGGTSTSQSPSHSYSSLGAYTVSLTATNTQGQDSEVKLNYITVVNQVTVYPDTWTTQPNWADAAIVSGGLTNLQSDDQSYMVMQPTNAAKRYAVLYTADTSYTPSQISHIYLDYQAKSSTSANPGSGMVFVRTSGGSWQVISPWLMGTSDTNWNWETGSASSYMDSNGVLGFEFCGCPNDTTSYTVSSDVMRWRLELPSPGAITPVAELVASPRSGTSPLAVTFTDCSSNTPTSWSWTFGDGSTSTSRNPSHTYNSAGNYTVALTATNSAGSNTKTKTSYITVSGSGQPPVANFTGTPTSGTAPLAVSFTDTSTNTPTSWSWTFGDGNTSTTQSPGHTYGSVGSLTVTLTATNAYGSDGETKTNYITVTAPAPVASFTATPVNGQASLAVAFTDTSTNSPTSWSWSFGDSTTSTSQNPSHTYSTAGDYTVSLRATNAAGYDDELKTNYIAVSAANEVIVYPDTWAANSYTPGVTLQSGGLSDLTSDNSGYMVIRCETSTQRYGVMYTVDTSYTPSQATKITVEYQGKRSRSDTPTSGNLFVRQYDGTWPFIASWVPATTDTDWTWNSTAVSTYMSSTGVIGFELCTCPAGGNTNNYDVSSDKMRFRLQLTTVQPPVANFTGTPVNGQASLAVAFTDTSTNTPTSWSWTFGDGSTSTTHNPSHTYTAAGDYTVALTATNSAGSNTKTQTNYITVSAANEVVVYPDTWSVNWYTPGVTLQSGALADVKTDNGAYMVARCDTSTQRYGVMYTADTVYTPNQVSKITWEYQGKVSRSDTPASGVVFARKSDGVWEDRGSWVPGTADTDWTWNSTAVSTYMDSNGVIGFELCCCPTGGNTNNYDVSSDKMRFRLQLVTVQPPVANFTGTPTSGTKPLTVAFTDTSTNTPTSWSWNFGDSSTSTSHNPSHTYNSVGSFTVSLRATNSAGYDDEVKTNYITVNPQIVYAYPNAWATSDWAQTTLSSGSLTDLQSDNGIYMVMQCNTTNHRYWVEYTASTGYTPGQVSKLTIEYQSKRSRSDTPTVSSSLVWARKSDGTWYNITTWLPGTSDTNYSWETTAVSTYMSSSGVVGFRQCGCPTSGNNNNYTISSDLLRFKLTLN